MMDADLMQSKTTCLHEGLVQITQKLKASILIFTLLDGCFPGSSLYCLWPPQQLEESWFLGQTLHTRRSGTGTRSPTSTKRLDPLNWFCSSSNSHFFIYQPWGEARMLLQSLCVNLSRQLWLIQVWREGNEAHKNGWNTMTGKNTCCLQLESPEYRNVLPLHEHLNSLHQFSAHKREDSCESQEPKSVYVLNYKAKLCLFGAFEVIRLCTTVTIALPVSACKWDI